jgi:uncharacterized protein
MTQPQYRPSRYISMRHNDDGTLTVHSSRTGAIGTVDADKAGIAREALKPNVVTAGPLQGILADLHAGGFLVEVDFDEILSSKESYLSRYTRNKLHLIVMPTEQCNFRCVYCYESFLRGTMSEEIQQAIERFVESHAQLDVMNLQWFGGEPLLARDVVLRITSAARRHSAAVGATFFSGATTNGYLLTPAVADAIIPAGVTSFQITLDGTEHDHDERRVGAAGEKTFATIMSNLRYLRDSSHEFTVMIRHNFDPSSMERFDDFLKMIEGEFSGDARFVTNFEAIGKWGGPNDDQLEVYEGLSVSQMIAKARRAASKAGFADALTIGGMQPEGYVCYAADPNSFVIGSDGKLYKCTIELDYHDRNIVGQLLPDGRLDLDWRKMALWCETDGMEEGKKCSSCWFSPSCKGAICPKEWMDSGDVGCAPVKVTIQETLSFIREESLYSRIRIAPDPYCPKG